jgi:hypothetical protein
MLADKLEEGKEEKKLQAGRYTGAARRHVISRRALRRGRTALVFQDF